MNKLFENLKNQLASFTNIKNSIHPNYESFISECQLVLMAGGEGSRMANLTKKHEVNKNALKLPNDETMIERTISMYKKLGLKDVIILVYNQADSIVKLLGDGNKYGVKITYGYDPEKPVGKGGAIKHALVENIIKSSAPLIVHNPDDQIVGDSSEIIKDCINQHLYNQDKGALASVIVVVGSPYNYTGMQIQNSKITAIEMYPFIPIPTHIGMTIFTPEVYPYFNKLFDLNKKTDFESVLFPLLQAEDKLYACQVPLDSWISVNDEKGLKKLITYLS